MLTEDETLSGAEYIKTRIFNLLASSGLAECAAQLPLSSLSKYISCFLSSTPIQCCILIWASFTFILNFLHAICSLTLSWDTGQAHHFPFQRQLSKFVCIYWRWWEWRKRNQPLGNVQLYNKRYIWMLSIVHLSDTSVILGVNWCFDSVLVFLVTLNLSYTCV